MRRQSMQIVFSPCILWEEKKTKTLNEWIFEEKLQRQQHSDKIAVIMMVKTNPWISLSSPIIMCMMMVWHWLAKIKKKFHIASRSEYTMQIICQMKKIYAESWCELKHTAEKTLDKDSINLFVCVRENVECRSMCRRKCTHTTNVYGFCCCYRAASTMFCMDVCIIICNDAIEICKFAQANCVCASVFSSFFFLFWSFSCIFEIHSLDTLNNYSHCSAYFDSLYFLFFSSTTSVYCTHDATMIWRGGKNAAVIN